MEQMNRTHFQNFMAKLENFREEEIQVLQEYLEPVFEVREKILSSFSDEKASSRFSVGEISDEPMYVNLLEDLFQTDERVSECRMDFDACDMILYHKQPEHSYDSMKTTEQKYEGVAALNLFYRELGDAMFYYNPDEPNKGCVVIEKIISLSDEDFWFFGENIRQEASFIADNEELQYFDQQMTLHCLFIQKEDAEFGVLISHDQKSGEVYSGYLPNLDQFQEIGCEISEKEDCMEPQM
nr:hypothetical protein [uncultured Anaerotignum sp.]